MGSRPACWCDIWAGYLAKSAERHLIDVTPAWIHDLDGDQERVDVAAGDWVAWDGS
jgi:hypothetical protein